MPCLCHINRVTGIGQAGRAGTPGGGKSFVSDIFHEVDEEVRREQLKKLWDRYGNYVVAAVVLLIAGIGAWRGYEWWEAKKVMPQSSGPAPSDATMPVSIINCSNRANRSGWLELWTLT